MIEAQLLLVMVTISPRQEKVCEKYSQIHK